jgi:hypothetical protein
MKRTLLAIVAVFVVWSVLDFVIHGILLQSTYEATAGLWRPMDEMNMPMMYLVTLAYTACFVAIYDLLVSKKSLATGIRYGGLFGLGAGISMGFGSYSFMPIPLSLAWGWFFGMLVEAVVAGALVGAILRPDEDHHD